VSTNASAEGWLPDLVQRIEARLSQLFAEKRALAKQTSPAAESLIEAVEALTMRGGKRLRPAVLYAGFCAVTRDGAVERTLDLGAALELLQTYLLIQDDWMDGDDERRGGPAVHAAFARAHRSAALGASLAVLASDLAAGFAWELAASAALPPARLREGLMAFGRMHAEVVYGQQLDLLHHEDVARMHDLKTGSYTVSGPLRLGAVLGDASAAQLEALARFGKPVGLAFQLRDDLLGVFGDPQKTGKPVGNDLRVGKCSSLVAEARKTLDGGDRAALDWALGNPDAGDDAIARALELLVRSGARDRVEKRLRELTAQARAALADTALVRKGASMLGELCDRMVDRSH
jgi:geranylgeranyl diphosphate synthase type I